MNIVKRISTVLALLAFAAAVSFPVATSAEPGPPAVKAPVVTSSAPVPPRHHPEIDDAMRLLNEAQDHLNHASHDFGGHRLAAMDHISKALDELHKAVEYANHH